MPSDYALHEVGTPYQGNMPPAPKLPAYGGQIDLAEDTPSADIVVTCPSALVIVADARVRLDLVLAADVGDLAPAASGVVLEANQPRFFYLEPGTYNLETTAA